MKTKAFSKLDLNAEPKVYLTGGDNYNWALDEDLQQTKSAIAYKSYMVDDLDKANIIHSVYWGSLKNIPSQVLKQKRVICNLSGEWSRYENDFADSFAYVSSFVDVWVVRSQKAQEDVDKRGGKSFLIPYTVNADVFYPIDKDDLKKIRSLPQDKYIIGNFMRDTQGEKGGGPKLVKGPDIFADIVTNLYKRENPIHVLLAGPRRHWLRKTLKQCNVPFTYFGWSVPFEDMRINTLSRTKLNLLYNRLDLSLVSSRSEAGPHAILEAAASQCSQISTPVGIATDVLSAVQIYRSVDEAVDIIEKDIETSHLRQSSRLLRDNIIENYTSKSVKSLYKELYERVLQLK